MELRTSEKCHCRVCVGDHAGHGPCTLTSKEYLEWKLTNQDHKTPWGLIFTNRDGICWSIMHAEEPIDVRPAPAMPVIGIKKADAHCWHGQWVNDSKGYVAVPGNWYRGEDYGALWDAYQGLLSGHAPETCEYPSVHVISVPWCQCCAARVPADHVCACEGSTPTSVSMEGWPMGDTLTQEGVGHTQKANETPEQRSQAATDVLTERNRQVAVEGWTPEHDDQHNDGELAEAAVAYADSPEEYRKDWPFPREKQVFGYGCVTWPKHWSWDWWKPKDPRRDLVRAAALLIAEIERLDRASMKASEALTEKKL